MFASILSGPAFAGPEADVPNETPDASAPHESAALHDSAPSNPYNQGTTADGKTIVAPGTYGPFQTPTCEAGSAGCTAATSSTGDAAAAAANNALEDIGKQQRDQEVKKMEDEMVKNGTYKSITRDPSGKGAVITLPNGMIAYSDYEHGLDTMPKTPEQWAADPNAPASVVAAAKKMIYDQANAKMFGATSAKDTSGKMSMLTDAGKGAGADPAPTEAGASDQDADPTDPNSQADVGGMGGAIASNFGGGNGGSDGSGLAGPGGPGGGSSDRARADNQKAMESTTKQAVESAGDGEQAAAGYTYERLAREAREGEALKALRNSRVQSSNGAESGDSDVQGDKVSRGTGFFGR
jgi:hypothetical protein